MDPSVFLRVYRNKAGCTVHCYSHLIEDSEDSKTVFVTCGIVEISIILLVHDNVQLQWKPDKQE
jgi:hypothetical protein